MHHIFLNTFFAVSLSTAPAVAEEFKGDRYYQAQTIITGVLEPERTRGFREGLREIFVKVTNSPELADDERLKPFIEHASDYIAAYTLEDRNKHLKLNDEQGTRDRPHYLRMKADREKLDSAIASLGFKPWLDRPVFQVLLVVHDPRGAYLIGDELRGDEANAAAPKLRIGAEDLKLVSKTWDGYEQREALKSVGVRRGYDIVFPKKPGAQAGSDAVSPTFPPVEQGRRIARWHGDLFPDESGYWRLEARAWTPSKTGEVNDNATCYTGARGGTTFDISLRESLDALARVFRDGKADNCEGDPA